LRRPGPGRRQGVSRWSLPRSKPGPTNGQGDRRDRSADFRIQSATQEAGERHRGNRQTISRNQRGGLGRASAVEEQGAATQEIARNVEQAAAGTQEVSANIGGVSQAANETGTAAGQINRAAGELSQQSEKLRAEVDRFLQNLRAA